MEAMEAMVDERWRWSVSATCVKVKTVVKDVKDMEATFLIVRTRCDYVNLCSILCIVYDEQSAAGNARGRGRKSGARWGKRQHSWRHCRLVSLHGGFDRTCLDVVQIYRRSVKIVDQAALISCRLIDVRPLPLVFCMRA